MPKLFRRHNTYGKNGNVNAKNVLDYFVLNSGTAKVLVGSKQFPVEAGEMISFGNGFYVQDVDDSIVFTGSGKQEVHVMMNILKEDTPPRSSEPKTC